MCVYICGILHLCNITAIYNTYLYYVGVYIKLYTISKNAYPINNKYKYLLEAPIEN